MTREQARQDINSRITELPKAKKHSGGYDTYICPFCGNGSGVDGTGISTKDGVHYKCFKCDFSGDYLALLRQRNGASERDIFERYGLHIDGDSGASSRSSAAVPALPSTEAAQAIDYKDFFLHAAAAFKGSPAEEYLRGRGISPETADRFKLGYVPDWKSPAALRKGSNPSPSRRIIIPTSRQGYTARSIDPQEKYRFQKEGDAEFFNFKALQGAAPVFIVEGAIDALAIAEAGGEACAIGSTSGVNRFLTVLDRSTPTVPLILSLDNDEAGRKAQAELKAGLESLKIAVYEVNTAGGYKDPNDHLTANRDAFIALVNSDPAAAAQQEAEAEKEKYLTTAAAYHINDFMGEIAASADTPAIPSGFDKLDDALDGGLYEGLYVVGAITSLGKTTFILQSADQIAQRGQDVLIFSLEMSRFELMAKSISRLTFENCGGNTKNAKTTRGILAGAKRKYYSQEEKELINRSIAVYAEYSDRIYIHEGIGTIGTEEIKQEVQRHISFTGNTPVVVIDYLQILAPYDMRATDKQNTDKAVLELKRLSRDKKIPVIAISSFNRENYTAPVNLASFKESGAIEYSSDVLLGLQLAGMDELSQSEGKRVDTIKQIEEKKAANPRKAQLKILKNRNGKIGIRLYYDYYPMFNCFNETESPTSSGTNARR